MPIHNTDIAGRFEEFADLDALKRAAEAGKIRALPGLGEKTEKQILEDGSLDLPDSLLKLLDVVVISVHSKFNLSAEQHTERIMRAAGGWKRKTWSTRAPCRNSGN